MTRYCLVIDDNDQSSEIETLCNKGKEQGLEIICHFFNPSEYNEEKIFKTENGQEEPEILIQVDKFVEGFQKKFHGQHFDLIAFDYNLDDPKTTGVDLIRNLRQLRKKTTFILYSGTLSYIVRDIVKSYKGNSDESLLLKRVKTLITSNITNLVRREDYDDEIIRQLRNPLSPQAIIEKKLLEYPDLIFKSTFPLFENLPLSEIAAEISQNSLKGEEFLEAIIELTIAHLIELNE